MSDTPHPMQVEAELFAAERRKKRKAMKAEVLNATNNGMHFLEITPTNYAARPAVPAREGRMTIAYAVDRRNVVAIATALCHPDDQFDKLLGRHIALTNFIDGAYVMLRVPTRQNVSVKQALSMMFTHHTY